MTVAVKRYLSTMTGAPTLLGNNPGDMISILDAVLVNGFNTRTLTSLTRSGSTATGTFTSHGYNNNDIVLIAGATQTDYNGEFRVFSATANTFDYTVTGTPATPATGTITAKIASLNWAKTFSGTNKAVYRSADVTVSRPFLRVDDSGVSGVFVTSVRAFESMTDVDTGLGQFPTNTQIAANIFSWLKGNATNNTVRNWIIVGDTALFYIFIGTDATNPDSFECQLFGDPISYRPGDAFSGMIVGNAGATQGSGLNGLNGIFPSITTVAQIGHFVARASNQLGSSVQWSKVGSTLSTGMGIASPNNFAFPSPVDNGFIMFPIYVCETANAVRGTLPGMYHSIQILPLGHLETISMDVPGLTGTRTILIISMGSGTFSDTRRAALDITGPWR